VDKPIIDVVPHRFIADTDQKAEAIAPLTRFICFRGDAKIRRALKSFGA
jgi:hypothetical protein